MPIDPMCADPDVRSSLSKIHKCRETTSRGTELGHMPVGTVPTNAPNGAHMAHTAHSEPRQPNAPVSTPMSVDPDERPLPPAAA
jgi:hypothetical protein